MNIKKHIPNLFTLGNLFFGTLAAVFANESEFFMVAVCVLLGIVLDFFDGFLARLLKVQGELGKQLDSLADMVTSGVVPGLVIFKMMQRNLRYGSGDFIHHDPILDINLIGFVLTLAACYRLANFNIDTRQSDSFIGLPTPAMSLFIIALPLIFETTEVEGIKSFLSNNYALIGITLVLSYLMNANLPLLALKFKSFGLKGNLYKYLLIVSSIVLIVTLEYASVPLIIVVYILLSIVNNMSANKA